MNTANITTGEGKAGFMLSRAIHSKALELGINKKEVARRLGLSYVYFVALANGTRTWDALNKKILRSVATFLGVPLVQVLIWAETLEKEDFIFQQGLDDRLEIVLRQIKADPFWCLVAPSSKDWAKAPADTRLFAALLYERVSGKDLIDKAQCFELVDAEKEGAHDCH